MPGAGGARRPTGKPAADEAEGARVVAVLAKELAPVQAARLAAALTGCARDALYRTQPRRTIRATWPSVA